MVRVGGDGAFGAEGSAVAHSLQYLESDEFSKRQWGQVMPMMISLAPGLIYTTIAGPEKGPDPEPRPAAAIGFPGAKV